MMSHPLVLFTVLFGVHIALGVVTYVERRLKPLMASLRIWETNTCSIVLIAKHYDTLGMRVPDQLLIEPDSVLTSMLRRLEARVSLEVAAVLFVALIPSSVLTAFLI